ncbi:leiomodin-1 isoform X1 [Hemibagrus wyckioides]|uniref:leiomodin-1 isoform X1 n=1 Tax=Hemibagrus wyckioides TaxID=337641 RepID=UPI00266D31E9|nr:leiomodin-1 isoform X1 [Hemibagrus wyckioides]
MSRRKVRGLTRTGRQVSEDPDLDNLLSNLSPEEMEELQKEVSTVPDPDPSEIIVVEQTDLKQTIPNKRDSTLINHGELKTGFQRNLSTEGEPRRESRKQEYLRKMGLSQETNVSSNDSKEGSHSIFNAPVQQVNNMEDKNTSTTQHSKDDRVMQFKRSKESEMKFEVKVKEQNHDDKHKDKCDKKEGISKTKELISRLQEQKEVCKEKEKRDESWKRESGDSKTREMISRLQGKQVKEEKREHGMRAEISKRQSRTKSLGLGGNQNLVVESKQQESSRVDDKEKTDEQVEIVRLVSNGEKEIVLKDARKNIESIDKESDKKKRETDINEVKEVLKMRSVDIGKKKPKAQNEIQNETPESTKKEMVGNCVAENNSNTMSKEQQEEDETASMFAEDLERLLSNDPSMTEVNVNNSEVINVKTLIQFAEALKNNTHVKTFALANCRADDHVAYAIASMLSSNKIITSINMDSNLLTNKGIMALVQALQYNTSLSELRFHNQRHICGGKTEMEMTKILKENTTLLKLGYHFELAGPRMTMTNILSRNMDRQRQKRLQEQKQTTAQEIGDKKDSLKVPQPGFKKGSPKHSPKPSPSPSPAPSPKLTPKAFKGPGGPPLPPPGGVPPPPPPILDGEFLKNSLTPMSQRKLEDRTGGRGCITKTTAIIRQGKVKHKVTNRWQTSHLVKSRPWHLLH